VDDDIDVLMVLSETLAELGYRTVEAMRADIALDHLRRGERFAVMVTDQAMPGMTGNELIVEAMRLLPGLPCLLVTGFGDIVEPAGAAQVLRKPYRAADLAAALERLTNGQVS
jgi:DNA-binding NtrC family response regulator